MLFSRLLPIWSVAVLCAGCAVVSVGTPMMYAQAGVPAGPQTGVKTGGSVTGTVLDPDGAAIPGATILLTPPKGAAVSAK